VLPTVRPGSSREGYEDKGAIQTSDPLRRLAFTHFSPLAGLPDRPENYHTVTFELAPVKGGTEVALTQANLLGGEALRRRASSRLREELDDGARWAEEGGRDALTGATRSRSDVRHRPASAGGGTQS
jgi:hypothetical protein